MAIASATPQASSAPATDRNRQRATLAAVVVSTFMLPLDYTVVAVALSEIERDLGAGFTALQWVVNGYTLSFAAFLLAGGALADRWGRRRMFLLGMGLFGASSLACGLAPDALVLNIARLAQGVGAAVMFSASIPLLTQEFDGPARARAFGVYGAVVGAGAALGPFIGGAIIAALGWRWAFLVNVPVTAALVALTLAQVRESRDSNAITFDWTGFLTFTPACFALIFALIHGNDLGWASLAVLAAAAAGAGLLALFVRVERRARYPMFDLTLFRSALFVGTLVPPLVLSVGFWGVFLYMPLYYQGALGYSPLQAGAAVLPFALPLMVMGPVGARLAARLPAHLFLALGQALVGLGAVLLLVGAQLGSGWTSFALGAFVSGAGTGLINGQMTNVAMSIVPAERAGMASGINSTMRQVGVALGFAGFGALLAARTEDLLAHTAERVGVTAAELAGPVLRGDIASAAALAPEAAQRLVQEAARGALLGGLEALILVAALVGFVGAFATHALIRQHSRDLNGGCGVRRTV